MTRPLLLVLALIVATASTSTTTTTTAPGDDAAAAAADWDRQDCELRYGPIVAPDPLPPSDDGAGCQHFLLDFRAGLLAAAVDAHRLAAAAYREILPAYNTAKQARADALAVLKAAEAAYAEAGGTVATTTTTTTLPAKPTTSTTSSTSSTTTLAVVSAPEIHRTPDEINAQWHYRRADHDPHASCARAAETAGGSRSIAHTADDIDTLDWDRLSIAPGDQEWIDRVALCKTLLAEWIAAGYTTADDPHASH